MGERETPPTELAEAIARHRPRRERHPTGGFCDACTLLEEVDRLRGLIRYSEAERLRAALEWYAAAWRYDPPDYEAPSEADLDAGKRAREALGR
jgi:hypothetical protein